MVHNPTLAENAIDRLFLIGGFVSGSLLTGFYIYLLMTRGLSILPSAIDLLLLFILSAIAITVGGVFFILPALFVLYLAAYLHYLTPLKLPFLSIFYEDLDRPTEENHRDTDDSTTSQSSNEDSTVATSPRERKAYRTLNGYLDTIDTHLDSVAEDADVATPEQLQNRLDEVESALDRVETNADRFSFPDIDRRIDRQRSRCTRIRNRNVSGSETAAAVPETIPTTPQLSIEYDNITVDTSIGKGGNADVYHAVARGANGDVELAVKQPRMSGTVHTETVERMLSEAETWQGIDDHDHIVSVVAYGDQPFPWIGMEYMDAGHLGGRLRELSFEQSLWTALAVTTAVRHAHRRGVAHLDLKPENILFRSVSGAWDVPKVADWGLSKQLLGHSKSVEGLSPQYAAPEQFDDTFGAVDDLTDVYQLGAVFYELFTGRPPFEGQPFEILASITDEEPTPPSDIVELPSQIDDILLTCLATEKADRYESVLYLRDELLDVPGASELSFDG